MRGDGAGENIMKLGLYIDMRNAPAWRRPWPAHYGRWLERIEEAERLGCESLWLTEHHFFDDGYLPQIWTLASAIAARTKSIRIGSAVALLPLHNPLEVAEQIALVDVISDGRAEPGFGVGYRKPEYTAFKGDFKHRYGEFRSRIHAMRAYWGEQAGADQTVTPAPLQRPMPLWGGFNGPLGARLAGELGLGLQSLNPELLAPYREGLVTGGRDPASARMSGNIDILVTNDPERAWAEIEPHVAYRLNSYNRYMFEGTSREHQPPQHFDAHAIRENFFIGAPADIAKAIHRRTADLPVTDLFFWADYPGLSDEAIDRHIRLAVTELAPLLRRAT
jgi:alkanesulfonate monooxygenase SsuD/methylene tetrahydromethanopterin reductase-like flavin-dependent oxidoreductase (luciferase family)